MNTKQSTDTRAARPEVRPGCRLRGVQLMALTLNDFIDQAALERMWDAAEAAERAAPEGSSMKEDARRAQRYLGELLATLDHDYGEPLATCYIPPDVEQRVWPWCGFNSRRVGEFINACVRFCMNVGWTLDELQAERQSERIR